MPSPAGGKPLAYGSVCSGIEAATVAWHPLGWTPEFFSEIEPFPKALLAHHYPNVPDFGDMTRYRSWDVGSALDVLVGGTPCQSFSVAGLRKGLDDPRGNLALVYLGLVDRFRPRWFVWENVPGVLSSGRGRDFGAFLGAVGQLGYGFAYRVLDAQFFGVPQRRRRVFVVGHLGDWRPAAAVLFERHSLSGDSPPRRETGQRVANVLTERADRGGGNSEGQRLIPDVANPLTARMAKGVNTTMDEGQTMILRGISDYGDGLPSLRAKGGDCAGGSEALVAHSLRADGFDASEDGTGRGIPLVPALVANGDAHSGYRDEHGLVSVGFPVEFSNQSAGPGHDPVGSRIRQGMAVRRLTPRECERLQGFPDHYTLVPYRNKPAADGPRYKALGNSMAVPVMRWIGERIQAVDDILKEARCA